MLDLRDVTFTIPLRYDTDDRIRNFMATLGYMAHNLDTNFIIYEDGPEAKFNHLAVQIPNCRYHFNKNNDELFHRTLILNEMVKMTNTPFLVNLDVDCIVHLPVYQDAVNKLRNDEYDIMTGFSSLTYTVPKTLHEKIATKKNIDWLTIQHCVPANKVDFACGGIVWWQKKKLLEIKGDHQGLISWAPEDQERVYRAQKLGYRYGRVEGTLFHLDHARLTNSWMNHKMFKQNEEEFEKIKAMSVEELRAYVASWPWLC